MPRLDLFSRAPSFRLLFFATLGSGLGTWLAAVALAVDVFDRTGSAAWVAGLLIADIVPAVAIGLALGPLLDRLSRRRLMIASDLVRVLVFVAVPFAGSATQIIALAAVSGFATGFFRPAVYAGLPNLVEERDLPRANSLLQTVENLTLAVGPPLGGAIVAAWGPDPAYWFNAATFLLSGVLVAAIPARLLQTAAVTGTRYWRDLREGLAVVLRARPLLTVLIVWNVFMLAAGGVNVATIVLAKVALDAGDFGYGVLIGASGVGLVIGSFFAGGWIERRGLVWVYGVSIALVAAGIALAAVSPNVGAAASAIAIYGIGNGVALVCNALFVQRGAPDHLRGRAFTVLMGSNFAVFAAAMIVAGPLTDAAGARWVFGSAAVLCAAAAAIAIMLARGAEAPPAERFRSVEPEAEAAVEAHGRAE
jgi:MFS family permease